MIYTAEPTRIKDDMYCLGPSFLPAYLLDGEEPVLFDAGMSFVGEHYETELKKILNDRPLKILLLSHMHFDHCGAAGYLKRLYPDLAIYASAEGAEIIQKPSALHLIDQLSGGESLEEHQRFVPFTVDRIVKDGDRIMLSDNNVIEVIANPGHTRDMLSYYLPKHSVMIPSEAAGVPAHDNYIYSEFLVDCDLYFQSLERLSRYQFDTILLAHNYFYTNSDAHLFINRAIELGYQFRNRLSELLDRFGSDFDSICSVIKKEEYDRITDYKQIESAYLINLQAKIRAVERWRMAVS